MYFTATNRSFDRTVETDLNKYYPSFVYVITICPRMIKWPNCVSFMQQKNTQCTGVVRHLKNCPILDKKSLEKKLWDHHCQQTATDNSLTAVGWHDNRSVYAASNATGCQPLKTVQRWSRSEMKALSVNPPQLVAQYNIGMGGVDRADENISTHRISIRTNEW